MKKSFLVTIVFFLFSPLIGEAACDPRISVSRQSLDGANPVQPRIFIFRRNFEACNYFLTFSKGNSSTFNRFLLRRGNRYDYNLFKTTSLQTVLKDLPDATATEVVTGSFGLTGGVFNLHQIAIFRPDQPIKPAGRYRDTIRVSVFEGTFGSTTRATATRNMRVRYRILKEVRLSLVDLGASFDSQDVAQSLDFGTLQPSESLGFDLMVQSNAGYEISMSSQGNGRFRHVSRPTQTVDYTMSVDGVPKDLSSSLSSPVVVASGSGVTQGEGDRHTVRVVVGAVDGKMSGRYGDNVTVTVTSTE